nr:MAG TPA: hypothetical protein [Caudoviricetes sp.]
MFIIPMRCACQTFYSKTSALITISLYKRLRLPVFYYNLDSQYLD